MHSCQWQASGARTPPLSRPAPMELQLSSSPSTCWLTRPLSSQSLSASRASWTTTSGARSQLRTLEQLFWRRQSPTKVTLPWACQLSSVPISHTKSLQQLIPRSQLAWLARPPVNHKSMLVEQPTPTKSGVTGILPSLILQTSEKFKKDKIRKILTQFYFQDSHRGS